MFDAYDIDAYMQDLLHDSSAAMWNEQKRLNAINRSYEQVCNRIIEAHENYFYKEATLTPGTSTWEKTPFDLPAMPTIQKIVLVTDTEGRRIDPIPVQQREYSVVTVRTGGNRGDGYWLGHDTLELNAASFTSNLRLYYIRRPALFIKGTASAGTGTTLTMPSSPAPEIRDDYYNLCYMRLKEGTGAGERAQITDFDGGTGVATVDFTTTPSTDSVFATESELPEGHNEIVAMGAAIRCIQMDVAQAEKLKHLMAWYRKLEYDLMDYMDVRQTQTARSVYMRNMD